ncbi:hypothetical protein FRC00_006408 [Tulasnella sp. 408]|nr:hypothetical protein FRC00_006408 [Tulasnella sp. 408]
MFRQIKIPYPVEFYLSDSNLPYDKFMWTLHTKNDDHWIPIATLAGFKRMREYNTKYGIPWIAETLRNSEELLEVDEAGVNVRRAIELKPPGMTQYDNSAYAKGFPDEVPGLQQRIEQFFEQYAPIAGVRFRRTDKKDGRKFKNSVFAEFKNKAGLDAFLNADPKPTFDGKELLTMSNVSPESAFRDAYVTMKAKEKGFDVPDKSQILVGNIRRGFNAFKLMDEEAKKGKTNIESTEKAEEDADDEEEDKPEGITIDMDGRTYAVLSSEEVETVKEKVPTIAGSEVEWAAPSDEDERRFWLNRVNFFAKRRLEQDRAPPKTNSHGRGGGRASRGGRGGRGGGRGGRGGGGKGSSKGGNAPRGEKRKREETNEAPPSPAKPVPPPVVASAAKKVKLADGSAADA